MVAHKWLLPTLSEVLARTDASNGAVAQVREIFVADDGQSTVTENGHRRSYSSTNRIVKERLKAEKEWSAAIAALENLLLQTISSNHHNCIQGLVLTAPVPILSHPDLLARFQSGVFAVEQFHPLALMPFQLPPADGQKFGGTDYIHSLPLLPADPLTSEQFCVVFTTSFSLVMVVGEDDQGIPAFMFAFEPEVVEQAWVALRSRLLLNSPHFPLGQIDKLVEQFRPKAPDYRTVMQFSRLMLKYLNTEVVPTNSRSSGQDLEVKTQHLPHSHFNPQDHWIKEIIQNPKTKIANPKSDDVELLQALTHEVRTPLTTIRTMTRLLLKRRDLAPEIIRKLEIIDHECTEQINRMELIFKAVELETCEVKRSPVQLTAMSLSQVFQHCIPRWENAAKRRNLTLEVLLPQKLPNVVSNPTMLDQVLTGLIENFTRNIPTGGHIQVEVTPAGDQLKLQLQSLTHNDDNGQCQVVDKGMKSLGQLLMFQPETGSLSLNMTVTKNLFHALGGKLIVRQKPQHGEVLTIFLPLH